MVMELRYETTNPTLVISRSLCKCNQNSLPCSDRDRFVIFGWALLTIVRCAIGLTGFNRISQVRFEFRLEFDVTETSDDGPPTVPLPPREAHGSGKPPGLATTHKVVCCDPENPATMSRWQRPVRATAWRIRCSETAPPGISHSLL